MTKLFDKDGLGSQEIVEAVGLIGRDVSFDKWSALLPFGIRDLAGIVGTATLEAVSALYLGVEELAEAESEIVHLAQQAVAFHTWLRIIPTLDAQHDDSGRSRRLGENEKGLTALQEYKDEQNIFRLAYEATDALIAVMERCSFRPWLESAKRGRRERLLIRDVETFDEYYYTGSHRLFVTLLPMMAEVQRARIAPILGSELLDALLNGDQTQKEIRETACAALALLTMKKAVERLPVEVIPEGIVQVQESQPVKSRLRAEKEARAQVAASLEADARQLLERLEILVADLRPDNEPTGGPTGPIVHSTGLTF